MADNRLASIRASAAWAAWGDALGFITELTDQPGLRHRAGLDVVHQPVPWRRRVGGRMGISAHFPAGSYSDDTQLRLATSRAIRGDGEFDVEAFARVELVTWQAYHVGAGRGSKAAAAGMSRSDARWTQNTFATKAVRYVDVGGNGAAMRIQPHVWAAKDLADSPALLGSVLRDAICTHGHPVGIVGAGIHALVLAWAMEHEQVPGPAEWRLIIESLKMLPDVIAHDEDLVGLWQPAWEAAAGQPLMPQIHKAIRSAHEQIDAIQSAMSSHVSSPADEYRSVAVAVGGFADATRGSGIGTTLLAHYLACTAEEPAETLGMAANTLGTDTDTIASMAGAIMGAVTGDLPPTKPQDYELIALEAARLHAAATGAPAASYRYPDLLTWNPPRSALDLVGLDEHNRPALAGHGPLEQIEEPVMGGSSAYPTAYRWVRLRSGQKILVRHRPDLKPLPAGMCAAEPSGAAPARSHARFGSGSAPIATRQVSTSRSTVEATGTQGRLFLDENPTTRIATSTSRRVAIDDELRRCAASNYNPSVVGQSLLDLIAEDPGHATERAAAYGAAIARDLLQNGSKES